MTLNFPNRFVWLIIAAILLFLLQSGCQPIQPAAYQSESPLVAASGEEARAHMSTSISNESYSPDGNWIATSLFQIPRGSDIYTQKLVVTHSSGTPRYIIVDDQYPLALGYTVAEPLMWSPNGARFYYTNRPQADGCGLLFNGADLYALNLNDGEITELLPAHSTTTLGLSADEQRLAYLATGKPMIMIQAIDTGVVAGFDLSLLLEYAEGEARPQVGAFVWSTDARFLAFAVAHDPCVNGWAQSTSLYILDTQTMTATQHLDHDERVLIPIAWLSAETFVVENQQPIAASHQYLLDLATGMTTPYVD